MNRLKVVADAGDPPARWKRLRSWRPSRRQVGAALVLVGAAGWIALVVMSPYRNLIVAGTTFWLAVAGWKMLTTPRLPADANVVHHVHHRRGF